MPTSDPKTPGAKGVSAFIVPRDAAGFSVSKHFDKLGQRASDTADLANLMRKSLDSKRLGFIYLRIRKGAKADLGRPKTKPPEVRERFMRFIGTA